ncbi:MAG: zinc metallopeptidase [Planctomycetes bacterium]|nr:zinc metallopeptidase [Planctomycetota bacterium]
MIGLVFDYQYFLYVGPFLLLALWAQWKVKGTFARYAQVGLRSGVSGAEVAALILRNSGLPDVRIEAVDGMLSDHYDPQTRTVRLSRDVLTGRSAAAVAVAAHECGHALQHAQGYQAMQWRTALVPVVNLVNTLAMPMFLFGMFLVPFQVFALIAVIAFGAGTLFHLVTLPVEFDASSRAIRIVEQSGIATAEEMVGVRKVLYAAGFTYLAATLMSAAELVYWLVRSGLLGGNRSED